MPRKLPNAVAYGPGCLNGLVPECEPLPEGHGGAHQPDEAQSIDALCLCFKNLYSGSIGDRRTGSERKWTELYLRRRR